MLETLWFKLVVFTCCVLQVLSDACPGTISSCDFQDGRICFDWKCVTNQCNMETGQNTFNALSINAGGLLRSPISCKNDDDNHCFVFDYSFKNGDGYVLNVTTVQYSANLNDVMRVLSSKNVTANAVNASAWQTRRIPINFDRNTNFLVELSVSNNAGSGSKVLVDNIRYVSNECSTVSTLPPPVTPEAQTSPVSVSTTVTTISPTTTTPSTRNVTTADGTVTPVATTNATLNPSSLQPTLAPLTASSSNVGTIVGAVVAVIVLLAVIVIVFIALARRRGKDFWKTWLNKENRESTQTPDIRMNGLPHAKVLNENDQTLRPNGAIGTSNTAQPSSEDDYSVIQDSDGSFSPSSQSIPYAQVNKPQKGVSPANSDLPPSNLAPGFEYNHLDFGKRPATKTGSKPTANQNYSHINTSDKTSGDGAYSLAKTPQNSASRNESNYQEPLKAAGVYHILDSEPGNRESATSTDIYHVPDDGDNTNPSDDPRSSSVYHEPGDVSKPGRSHNANSIYYNPDDPKYSTQLASAGVYHTLESEPEGQRSSTGIHHVPDASSSKPQPPRKPVGVYEMATNPGDAPKKPSSPPKPNTGNSVYHVLEPETKPKAGVGSSSNYEIAEPLDSSDTSSSARAPSNSVYHLANASGFAGHQQNQPVSPHSGSKEGDYNSLDFNGKKLSQKAGSDNDANAVYSHLNEAGEDTYNEMNRGRTTEVIDGEYSHLGKLRPENQ